MSLPVCGINHGHSAVFRSLPGGPAAVIRVFCHALQCHTPELSMSMIAVGLRQRHLLQDGDFTDARDSRRDVRKACREGARPASLRKRLRKLLTKSTHVSALQSRRSRIRAHSCEITPTLSLRICRPVQSSSFNTDSESSTDSLCCWLATCRSSIRSFTLLKSQVSGVVGMPARIGVRSDTPAHLRAIGATYWQRSSIPVNRGPSGQFR